MEHWNWFMILERAAFSVLKSCYGLESKEKVRVGPLWKKGVNYRCS